MRAVRALRSGRTLRVHAADHGARLAEGRRQRLHVLQRADELGARDLIRRERKAVASRRARRKRSTISSSSKDTSPARVDRVADRRPAPYNREMALLSAQDEKVLTEHLSAIEKPVTLLLFTQTIGGSESGPVAKQVLDEVARLNDKITRRREELHPRSRRSREVRHRPVAGHCVPRRRRGHADADVRRADRLRVRRPGRGDADRRHGQLELEDDTLKLIAGVDKPTHIQVFITPT